MRLWSVQQGDKKTFLSSLRHFSEGSNQPGQLRTTNCSYSWYSLSYVQMRRVTFSKTASLSIGALFKTTFLRDPNVPKMFLYQEKLWSLLCLLCWGKSNRPFLKTKYLNKKKTTMIIISGHREMSPSHKVQKICLTMDKDLQGAIEPNRAAVCWWGTRQPQALGSGVAFPFSKNSPRCVT